MLKIANEMYDQKYNAFNTSMQDAWLVIDR